uniref:Uncharacterized protein n=1 Tax=Vespula pensylvanica TaxID=30213 RepID=A0A834KI55_VESPE|nr:hypothetical protein H0235_014628 [Vespula pensylvanica]
MPSGKKARLMPMVCLVTEVPQEEWPFPRKIHGKDLRDAISEENEERVQKSQEWKEKGRGIAKIDLIHTFLPDQGCSVILIVEIDRSDKSNRFLFDNLRLRSEMRRASFSERGIIRIF